MTPSPLHQPVVPLTLAFTLASILLLALTPAALPAPANPLTFEKDIRPILKAHCFDCHGEGDSPRGGLDLRLRRLMLQGGDEGPAITPGNPAQSRLLHLLESGAMPKRDRKPSRAEIDLVRDWIAAGAPTARPEPAELPKGTSGITEEERAFWSFQPIQPAPIPQTSPRDRARTPIDAFLRAAMPRDLAFAPDADRLTLLRRACFDLTGLPPTPEQIDTFLADTSPHAYETLVDRLLASPHYGERWGRHWLDVAGYADSEGYNEADPPRSHAYKYRDYVIRALNEDKPFDTFLTEQLAGDELARASHANASQVAVDSAANRDLLIATGFLRMGADGSAQAAPADHETVRNQVVADTLRIVTSSLLGLTVGCAQCHDHRYDPIPQADYYRLRAVFEPALDHRQWRNPADRRVSLHTDDDRRRSSEIETEAAQLAAERETQLKRFIAEALTKHLEKFEPHLRDPLRTAFETPADKRTPEQRKLLADHPSVNINAGVLYQYNPKAAEDLKAMDNRIAEVRSRKPPEDFIRALTEPPGHQPVTHLFHRGDPRQPRDPVGPGALSVLSPDGSPVLFPPQDPDLPTSGRRLAFARWLTSGTNPLVARVLVNRVWMHHFGRGLVGTPADFGTMGEKPSHPELLDWLAADFMRHGWRLKRLHRLILTSTAYRQSSLRSPDLDDADPDNRHYARQSVRRLDAEAIRDSMLAASGALNTRMFGPPVPVRPDVHGQIVVGEDRTEGDNKMPVDVPLHGEEFRRSVYIQVRRSRPLAMLHAFDAPVMEVNCERRQSSTVATQSLMLMNSAFVLDQSNRLAERLAREAADAPHAQVRKAWLLAFQRPPRPSEVADSVAFLQRQTALFAAEASNPPAAADGKTGKSGATPKPTPENLALAHFCQVLLSANEFLYLD